ATVASTAVVMVPVPVTTPTIRPPHLLISGAAVLEQPQPAVPATRVSLTLATAPPADWHDHFQLRFGALDGGTSTASARTRIGNVLDAMRGETVANEVLGSADASQAFQSFTLKKKPLTYVLDPSAPDRIRAALQVRVNGILWREVPSFFGITATDEVYAVRADPDGTPRITFGDGVRGARPA